MKFWTVLPLLLLGLSLPASADVAEPGHARCDASLSPLALTDCVFRNMGIAEKQLDKVIADYLPRLDANQRQLFDLAQREWKEYAIRACEYEASGALGGSAYPTIIALCRTRLTHRRRLDIIDLYQCREGDLNCPVPDPNAPDVDDDE